MHWHEPLTQLRLPVQGPADPPHTQLPLVHALVVVVGQTLPQEPQFWKSLPVFRHAFWELQQESGGHWSCPSSPLPLMQLSSSSLQVSGAPRWIDPLRSLQSLQLA